MKIQNQILDIATHAQVASKKLALLTTVQKNAILKSMSSSLDAHRQKIKIANQKDWYAGKVAGLSPALLDRLKLTDARIDSMIQSFLQVIALEDPIGKILSEYKKENGLVIKKIRVPIGVIGIIYESRPNVTADATALCLKSANAVILKGGSESIESNKAILDALIEGGNNAGLPEYSVQLITSNDRNATTILAQMPEKIDLIILRGGESLIKAITAIATVPVIKHYKGNCHVFVDKDADLIKALNIIENAKCQRPGVCNAMETLLIHEKIAPIFLPQVVEKLRQNKVLLKGDEKVRKIISNMKPATEKDWDTEYLDLILSIKIVKNIEEAIQHINTHGSHHSDAIVSENKLAQQKFLNEIDSAAVYVNASTRFTDGAEFGMGAEIGTSTDKLHARGPMGLEELTTYKYIIIGNGQMRI